MPSKRTVTTEVCWPCKYYTRHLWRSGLNPIYYNYCTHPSVLEEMVLSRREGRQMGENRPGWCPLTPDETEDMNAELRGEGWIINDD